MKFKLKIEYIEFNVRSISFEGCFCVLKDIYYQKHSAKITANYIL